MAASVGMLGQLGIDSASPVTKRFDYASEELVMTEEVINANGLRGTLSHSVTRCRMGLQRIGGPVRLQPNAVETALLLPWMMGGSTSGTPTVTYTLGDTQPSRYVTIDRLAKVFTYSGCKVNTATWRSSQGMPLQLDLQILGVSETVANSGTFPALSIDVANTPWVFHDCALVADGTTVLTKEFELTINNYLDPDRFFNATTLATVESHDRSVDFRCTLPYGDYYALYPAGSSAGVTVTATFTNGSAVLVFSMTKVIFPRMSPRTPGRVEIMLPLQGRAYMSSGGTKELIVTLNPGP